MTNPTSGSGTRYDVIVIGAGHNGLTTAALLAKRGRRVLVLERRTVVGGLAATEQFHPGFRGWGLLHESAIGFGQQRQVVPTTPARVDPDTSWMEKRSIFVPQSEGRGLQLFLDAKTAREEIAAQSPKDADRYIEYRAFLDRVRPFLNRLLKQAPPDITAQGWGSMMTLAGTGLSLRRLGRRDMMEILRIGPMCVADWLNEWFESDAIKCALANSAIACSATGPWSPATNAMLLRHEAFEMFGDIGDCRHYLGGVQKTASRHGAGIRTESAVREIRVEDGRVVGVTLESGESIDAPIVAASCDPKTLFQKLIESRHLPASLEHRIAHVRCSGTTVKVNLALDGPLRFACRPDLDVERAVIAESLDAMEKAFDPIKYRQLPERPILDVCVPTISSPDLAPDGKHVVSILAHFVPYDLEGGWTDDARTLIGDRVVARLAEYAPDVTKLILAREVLTPVDIESRYGVTGGHLHHVEHGLDQMITRPTPECARYATPIKGLYLCGSGSHPGGGITGLPGMLAADVIAKAT